MAHIEFLGAVRELGLLLMLSLYDSDFDVNKSTCLPLSPRPPSIIGWPSKFPDWPPGMNAYMSMKPYVPEKSLIGPPRSDPFVFVCHAAAPAAHTV